MTLVVVSTVVAEEEMSDEEMRVLFEAYEKMATKVTNAVLEVEEVEAKMVGEGLTDLKEQDVDSPLGL